MPRSCSLFLSQAVRQCLAAHPAAGEWRAAAAAALHLGRSFPEAVAALAPELLPGAARLVGGGGGGGGGGPHHEDARPGTCDRQGQLVAADAEGARGQAHGTPVGEQDGGGEGPVAVAVVLGLDADVALRLLLLAGAHGAAPQAVGRVLPGHLTPGLLRAVERLYGGNDSAEV